MNLNILEQLARSAMKGDNINEVSTDLVKTGVLSPVEHSSLSSLSGQIAASIRFDGTSSGVAAGTLSARDSVRVWI